MWGRAATAAGTALLLVLGPAAAAAAPAGASLPTAGRATEPDLVPGVLLVTTTGAAATAALGAGGRSLGATVAQVRVPPGSEAAAAAALAGRPGVVAVEQARYRRTLAVPGDPLYPRQWAHQLTGIEAAWDVTTGSPEAVVAVIDNGVDARHPGLRKNVREQRAFTDGSSYALRRGSDGRRCAGSDGGDHGTHVAGVVGSRGDDDEGVAGVAWNVSLLDYAVFSSFEGGCGASDVDVLAAIRTATLAGADVVNLSLGGFAPELACSAAYQSVIDEARAAGTVVVAASGNAEQDPAAAGRPNVPASCNGVISVGAVTVDAAHAPYSTTNRYVDLTAPGGDRFTGFADGVLSTVGDGGHDWLDGTSMAAPYVSGVVALLRSVNPDLTADEVEGLLESSARDLGPSGRDTAHGWGLVSPGAAVAAAVAGQRPQPAADPDFPVSASGGASYTPPRVVDPEAYRVSAGIGATLAVPQAVAMSQSSFAPQRAAHAVLARQDEYPDALAGSALTLGVGPLLFTAASGPLAPATRGELLRVLPQGASVYLLGGTDALPAGLEQELRALGFGPVRLSGATREETAVVVAHEVVYRRDQLGLPDPGMVALATSGNWPDAVAAGSFAGYFGVPILLTRSTALHPATARSLEVLRPERLLVLGGPAAVAEQVASDAARAAGTGDSGTTRVAGSDRYGTAIATAELFEALLADSGATPRCVLAANLVREDAFAHALSASTLAGAYGCVLVPVAGTAGERLPTITRGYVRRYGVDAVLAGDVDVISDAAAQDLQQLLQR